VKRPDNLKLGLRGIHHLAISVPSLERAKVFYLEVLGFTLADQISFGPDKQSDQVLELKEAQCASMLVNAGNIFLEIFEFDANETLRDDRRRLSEYGYTHFALDVEDIQVAYQYLADAGVTWHHHPVDTGDGYWMAYGRDPFGNVIEIQQLADGSGYGLESLDGLNSLDSLNGVTL